MIQPIFKMDEDVHSDEHLSESDWINEDTKPPNKIENQTISKCESPDIELPDATTNNRSHIRAKILQIKLQERQEQQRQERLISAVEDGDHSKALQLLLFGLSPHTIDRRGRSLLRIAEERNDQSMCKLLLEHSLISAVKNGDHSEAQRLLDLGLSPHTTDWWGGPLLKIAEGVNDQKMCNLLLNQSLLLERSLISAVVDGVHKKALRLLQQGVSPLITDQDGISLLNLAASRNDHPMCKLLLNYQHNQPMTEERNNHPICRMLIGYHRKPLIVGDRDAFIYSAPEEDWLAQVANIKMALELIVASIIRLGIMEYRKARLMIEYEYTGITPQESRKSHFVIETVI